MKISVYVPKELEGRLREQAEEQSMTPSLLVQGLVRERFEQGKRRFTAAPRMRGRLQARRAGGRVALLGQRR